MKIVRSNTLPVEAVSHEEASNPAMIKKILFRLGELHDGSIQMVNWANILPHQSSRPHVHADMQEVFVLINGSISIIVNDQSFMLKEGDACVVDPCEVHSIKNQTAALCSFLAIGIVPNK